MCVEVRKEGKLCVMCGAVMMIVIFCVENGDCVTCDVMISEVVRDVDMGCCDSGCCGVK